MATGMSPCEARRENWKARLEARFEAGELKGPIFPLPESRYGEDERTGTLVFSRQEVEDLLEVLGEHAPESTQIERFERTLTHINRPSRRKR